MDPTKIVVVVLCLLALGFLVWAEMNSRRNTKAIEQEQSEQSTGNSK
jgi:hypothetical protein